MKFGSWTYDGYRLDVVLEAQEGDTKKYVTNGEWDLIGVPAQRNEIIYVCCPEPYPDVTYTVHIRRRTKYYYINLIIPCALITCKFFGMGYIWSRNQICQTCLLPTFHPHSHFLPRHLLSTILFFSHCNFVFLFLALTLLSFFLPPDSGERITLVITNLLAMTVFMLIVAEIMPATSEVIPLISIYYTGIMFEVRERDLTSAHARQSMLFN